MITLHRIIYQVRKLCSMCVSTHRKSVTYVEDEHSSVRKLDEELE